MKRIGCFLTACLLSMNLCTLGVNAESDSDFYVTIDGVLYSANDSITYYSASRVVDQSITTVTIPAEINGKPVSCSENIFYDCPNLTEILVEEGNEELVSKDGILFDTVYHKNLALIAYPPAKEGEYVIPDDVSVLLNNSFKNCTGLTTITVSDSLEYAEQNVFHGCTNLTEIINPLPVRFAVKPFEGCTSLKSFTILTESDKSTANGFFVNNLPNLEQFDVIGHGISGNGINPGEAIMVVNCPKLKRFSLVREDSVNRMQTSFGVRTPICVQNCESLETARIETALDENSGTIKYYADIFTNCPSLQRIEYIGHGTGEEGSASSLYPLKLTDCPALEAVVYEDAVTLPRSYGHCSLAIDTDNCGDFAVYSYSTNQTIWEVSQNTGVPFKAIDRGDADGDGEISIVDTVKICRCAMGADTLTAAGRRAADVDANGLVDTTDAAYILQYLVKLINNFDEI